MTVVSFLVFKYFARITSEELFVLLFHKQCLEFRSSAMIVLVEVSRKASKLAVYTDVLGFCKPLKVSNVNHCKSLS